VTTINVPPEREITLKLPNASAVFLHQILGNQPVGAVAVAGQEGLFSELSRQIQAQNQPASVSPDIQQP